MTRASLWVGYALFLWVVTGTGDAQAKSEGPDVYGARNRFGVMAEYSNDSSHIILGTSENIKLGAVGLQYQRRLLATRQFVFSYAAEIRPAIFESSPTETDVNYALAPYPGIYSSGEYLTERCKAGVIPYSFTSRLPQFSSEGFLEVRCGRQMNFAQGMSPAGFRVNFRPRHRLQPTFSTLEGYIFSTKPLPIASAGSFNFAFELGLGLEYYLAPKRSIRLEYELQHYSNDYTAYTNPGVDSGIFKLSYSFGR